MLGFSGKHLDLNDVHVERVMAGREVEGYVRWCGFDEEAYRRGGQNRHLAWEAWQSVSWPLGRFATRDEAIAAVLARSRNAEARSQHDGW
jgi:hypothetical protein